MAGLFVALVELVVALPAFLLTLGKRGGHARQIALQGGGFGHLVSEPHLPLVRDRLLFCDLLQQVRVYRLLRSLDALGGKCDVLVHEPGHFQRSITLHLLEILRKQRAQPLCEVWV